MKKRLSFLVFSSLIFLSTIYAEHSPLHAAARQGDLNKVNKLIAAGQNVNELEFYVTPLQSAIISGSPSTESMVRVLLKAGAKTNDADINSAITMGNTKVVKILRGAGEKFNVDSLNFAIASRQPEIMVNMVLASGADVNKRGRTGLTPLGIAAAKGNVKILSTLLKKGAKVNAPNARGWTPLEVAVGTGNVEVVRMLLNAGAEPKTVLENVQERLEKWPLDEDQKAAYRRTIPLLSEKVKRKN